MSTKSNSLIMCTTPLQMIIAERIIALNSEKTFDIVILTSVDNSKYRYYFERIRQKCNHSLYYVSRPNFLDFLKFVKTLKVNKFNKAYDNLYIASIDSRHFQYIVSKYNKANIFTFDDGTANIIQNSLYYSNSELPRLKRMVWRAIGVKYYMDDIKRKSLIHYTIYDNIPNIINNIYLVNLFNEGSQLTSTNKTVKVFLGQPLVEISDHYSAKFIRNVVESYNIDYYFPHPREKELPKGNYKVKDSDLVFEDYIVNFLKEYPDIEVHVYSFTSSCLLNISQIHRVKPIFIYDNFLEKNFRDFYSLAKDKLNISTIKIESN